MKKTAYTLMMLAIMLVGGKAMAQDCSTILAPYFQARGIDADSYPSDKAAILCAESSNHFFFADEAPADAKIFNLSDVKSTLTGERIASDFVPDLNTFSYFAYTFWPFQAQDRFHTIYFRLPANAGHVYLAVRCENEVTRLVEEQHYLNKQ